MPVETLGLDLEHYSVLLNLARCSVLLNVACCSVLNLARYSY